MTQFEDDRSVHADPRAFEGLDLPSPSVDALMVLQIYITCNKKLGHLQIILATNRDRAFVGYVFLAQNALKQQFFFGTTVVLHHPMML